MQRVTKLHGVCPLPEGEAWSLGTVQHKRVHHAGPIDTTDPALFVEHMRSEHNAKPYTHGFGFPVRMFKAPTRREFNPGPTDVGSWVSFERKGRTITGQIWARHPGARRWWVADGTTYHVVDESEITRNERKAAA